MIKAIYPGSFDPITLGHIDIIKRVARQYEELIVLVAQSPHKSYWFDFNERMSFVAQALRDIKNVKVDAYDGLTVDYAKKVGATVIVRGLRALSDFENEIAMASINRKLAPEIETNIVFASEEFAFVASRLVKEVALCGGDLRTFVPELVDQAIQRKVKEREVRK